MATAKKFNFLTIDVPNEQYRMNFDKKINIISNKDEKQETD
jgi:hypothetical protein